jgi:pimeloyl-ACP methyl ester carboxylesterase
VRESPAVGAHTVTTEDGRSLEVFEGGDPHGPAVVAIYGTPSGGIHYDPHVAEAEARGIRLVSWTRPGYGASTPQPGRSVADFTADATAVADALGLDRFVVWGISGGGPHALACAALLGDRVTAAASLAGVAPYGAEGLDWLAGMGGDNLEEFAAVLAGREALEPLLDSHRAAFATATGEALREQWATLLSAVDAEVVTAELADHLVETVRAGLASGVEGWAEDDLAFVEPWGFALDAIAVPVLVWQGEEDRFVPPSHGRWLAEHVPGSDARLTAEDGHLTLMAHRVPAVHAWLLAQGTVR